MMRADERVHKLIDISRRLEGLSRHASTHAAGVVIGDMPLQEYLPLYRGKKDEIVTQYDMKMVEKVGLIKFDFLGLRTMTVIQDCLDLIRGQGQEPPDLDTLSLEDQATYELVLPRRHRRHLPGGERRHAALSPPTPTHLLRRHHRHAGSVPARGLLDRAWSTSSSNASTAKCR